MTLNLAHGQKINIPDPLAPESNSTKKEFPVPNKRDFAKIVRNSQTMLPGLTFFHQELPVTLSKDGGVLKPAVSVYGSFHRPGWRLYIGPTILIGAERKNKQDFKIPMFLRSKVNEMKWVAKGPNGETNQEQILIIAPDAKEFEILATPGEWTLGAGFGLMSYFQTNKGDFDSKTGFLSGSYFLPFSASRFGLQTSAFITMFTLSSTPSELGPQFLGANLHTTYQLGPLPFKTRYYYLGLGARYFSIIRNGAPFGFSNLLAPEVSFRTRFPLRLDRHIDASIYLSPFGKGLKLNEGSVQLKIIYSTVVSGKTRVDFDLGLTRLGYVAQGPAVVQTQLISFGISYRK